MARKKNEKIPVRWIDADTGEDITDLMSDPAVPPGEGILALAGALGRLLAAEQAEAERALLSAIRAELKVQLEQIPLSRSPEVGDELLLNGVSYRYDGTSGGADHFTRLDGLKRVDALASLKHGSAEARWLLQQLAKQR